MSMIVKVCGMRDACNIRDVEATGADWMGFICYERSPRYVSDIPSYLPQQAKRVGVFVNAPLESIPRKVIQMKLDYVQLHGHESPEYCAVLQQQGIRIIKAFSLRTVADLQQTDAYQVYCDYFLFDTPCPEYGGSGKQFDWSLLAHYRGKTPFLLSGGLCPDSLDALSGFHHPQWAGIDLNSGFETAPALKDASLLRSFISQFKLKCTMNRINRLFENKKQDILSLYFCAGTPRVDQTADVIRTLAQKGIDMIEIGIPFSDPMADGPVIQAAATQALRNGMTLKKLFSQLASIRYEVQIPLILMGYLNPIMQYGFEAFCQSCQTCGIDGMIIPDLPFKDYLETYKPIADRYGLKVIMLITPETSEERIRLIDKHTDGFIYMVSSAATTGAQQDFDTQKQEYFQRIASLHLKNPRMIGFGISNRQTFQSASAHAAGCIIGSKFVGLLEEEQGDAAKAADRLLECLHKG